MMSFWGFRRRLKKPGDHTVTVNSPTAVHQVLAAAMVQSVLLKAEATDGKLQGDGVFLIFPHGQNGGFTLW